MNNPLRHTVDRAPKTEKNSILIYFKYTEPLLKGHGAIDINDATTDRTFTMYYFPFLVHDGAPINW